MIGRRMVLQGFAAGVASAALPAVAGAATGKPGDFDFLTGEWRIANRMLVQEKWIEFSGEATVRSILNGIGSVEELRIPARDFSGMGLRMLDIEKKVWNDHWVNAKSGVVGPPQSGTFEGGVGTFTSEDREGDVTVVYRGVWDRITPASCRWFQGGSRDGGRTWRDTWFMAWTRIG